MTGGDAPAVIGTEVEVEVIVPSSQHGDKAVASRRRAITSRRWSMIELACSRGETVKGIFGRGADGYVLDVGLLAQVSHFGALHAAAATGAFDVIEASSRANRLVVCAVSLQAAFESFADHHQAGDRVEGVVTKIMHFGAFVDVGGIGGLLHFTEIPGAQRGAVEEHLAKGQRLEVEVISLEHESNRIALSVSRVNGMTLKPLQAMTAEEASERFRRTAGPARPLEPRVDATPPMLQRALELRLLDLVNHGEFDAVVPALEAAIREGAQIDPRPLHKLMRHIGRLSRPAVVEQLLRVVLANDRSETTRAHAYQASIQAWAIGGDGARSRQLLHEAAADGVANSFHYVAAADGLVRCGAANDAAELLAAMAEAGLAPSAWTFQPIAAAVCAAADVPLARALLQTLRDNRIEPGAKALAALRSRDESGLGDFYPVNGEEMEEAEGGAEAQTSHNDLSALVEQHAFEELESELRTDTVRQLLQPRGVAKYYTDLLSGLSRDGRLDEAVAVLERMSADGVDRDGFHFSAVMIGAGMQGDAVLAQRLLGDMIEGGVCLHATHISGLVSAMSGAGHPQAAEHEMSRLDALGVEPHPRHHYGPIISGYRRLGLPNEASRVVGAMRDRGIVPDQHHVSDLMHAWSDRGAIEEVESLFDCFVKSGGTPDRYHLAALIKVTAGHGDLEACQRWFDEMLKLGIAPGAIHVDHLMKAYAAKGDYQRAQELFARLSAYGIGPNKFHCATLVLSAASSRDEAALEAVTSLLDDQGALQTPSVLSALVRAWMGMGRRDRAIDLADCAPERTRKELALSMLIPLAQSGNEDEIESRIAVLAVDRASLPSVARAALVIAATRSGDTNRAGARFDELIDGAEIQPRDLTLVLGALAGVAALDRARRCADRLAAKGHLRGWQVGQLLDAHTKAGDAEGAEDAFRHLFPTINALAGEEAYLYNLLLRAFSRAERHEDVERLKEEMLARGLRLDRFSLEALAER